MGKKWIYGLVVIGLFLGATSLMAQTVETTETVERADSLFKLLTKGGIVMIPLFLCSVMTVTLGLERFISLGRKAIMPQELDDEMEAALEKSGKNNIGDAIKACEDHPCLMADIYQVGLDHWDDEADVADKLMGDSASLGLRKLRRSIRPLRLIAGIAPLMGLLGTVIGMIRSFQTVALSSQSINKAELLAEGIYQAMVTTATGLTIAIPTLILYFYFNNRIDKIGEVFEEKGSAFVYKHFRKRFKLES